MGVRLTIPETGPTELLELTGTTTLSPSTIAGMPTIRGSDRLVCRRTADIKELNLTGPDVNERTGVFAFGTTARRVSHSTSP
jgi:hypothetical protein